MWGSTYFFIRAAVQTLPAWAVVSGRFLLGAALAAAFAWSRGAFKALPSARELAGTALVGVLLLLLGNGLITVSERWVPSYAVSIIAACSPLWVALFNLTIFRKTVSFLRFLGVLVGVAGIALLLYDGHGLSGGFGSAILLTMAGVLCFSFGTAVAGALPKVKDVFLATAAQMALAGAAAGILGILQDPASLENLGKASAWSVFGVVYLAVPGTLAIVAFNVLLSREPSFRVSSYALVNPLIAVALGLAAGEKATPFLAWGAPLVLAGIALMIYGDVLRSRLSRRP